MKYFIRYGEIGVKSPKIRRKFENKLISNIQTELKSTFNNDQGRITLITEEDDEKVRDVLDRVFGIVSYSPVEETETDNEKIAELIGKVIRQVTESGKFNPERDTFAVKCRRVGTHDFSSQQMAAYAGSVVVKLTDAKVDLSNPDFTLYVEVRKNRTFIYHEKIRGLGGLPVGSQGRVVCLISGGIDSPVAGYLAMKRGIKVECIYFESPPHTSEMAKNKVKKLVEALTKYEPSITLHVVRFTDIQEAIYKNIDPTYMITIMRRMMYRICEKVMEKNSCLCLINGESVGQVASQTLTSMKVINSVTNIPVIRPVACLDKLEIIDISRKIGTYDISILPYEDCCTIFLPKHPVINPSIDKAIEYENSFDYNKLIEAAINSMETIKINGKKKEFDI